jgi:iron complex outermembrane receptor protein
MHLRVRGRSRVIDVLLIAALACAGTIPAFATETHQFNVPAEDAPTAIRDFATQAHVQILVAGENVKEKHFQRVSGELSTEQGLRMLLADSGLTPQYVGDRSVALVKASDGNLSPQGDAKEGKRSSSEGFRLAQVAQGKNAGASSVSADANPPLASANGQLTEVVVTAQKKSESLLSVPVPVSVVSADALVNSNQFRMQDYYTKIPGLALTPDDQDGGSGAQLAIRGITTGAYTNPTVGVTIDDVPYGSSTALGGGVGAPDVDPSDLQRIEVLRGPQGTLYGVSSIGGLVKFVTIDPSTDEFAGHVQANLTGTVNGANLGYGVRAGANIPISDSVGVRASAFFRRDPGYVDDVTTGQRGVNQTDADGGRIAALWHPSSDFTFKISALIQNTTSGGSSLVNPSLGDLKQDVVRDGGGYHKNLQTYSAVINWKVGLTDLTSLTGYSDNSFTGRFDYTSILGPFTAAVFGVPGSPGSVHSETKKLSQEIRAVTPIGDNIEWLFGGFYTHEHTDVYGNLFATVPTTGQVQGVWLQSDSYPTTFTEYALFTDLTVHFTPRFQVQFGGRESQNRQTYSEVIDGQYYDTLLLGFPSSPVVQPEVDTKDKSFTYLLTPQFTFTPGLMAYARLASGYRAGGPNSVSSIFGLPRTYQPDKTNNYELGLKGDFLSHALTIDASVFYTNWKDIQLQLTDPRSGQYFYSNGTRAKSDGIELSLGTKPVDAVTLNAWIVYNNAVLTQALPAGYLEGNDGDRLPGSAKWSGHLSGGWKVPLGRELEGFVGAEYSYVGDREGVFTPTTQRQVLPSYSLADVRGGMNVRTWTVTLSASNLADRRGVLGGGFGSFTPGYFTYTRPRTLSLAVAKTF